MCLHFMPNTCFVPKEIKSVVFHKIIQSGNFSFPKILILWKTETSLNFQV